jgi:tRNA pseudouridine55 synthase
MPRYPIDGVLLLNKPAGWTSNAALQKVKRLYNAAKAGHTGTLDPFASGLLPICVGQATKFSSYALHGDKAYRATLKLGVTTTTGDTEGIAVEIRPVEISLDAVKAMLPAFTGTLMQIPPMHSAIKHQGKALYEYARAGVEIERKPREITIYKLAAKGLDKDLLTLDVRCSGGTYIRTLAEDIGEALGCGAHLIGLERTDAGPYSVDHAHTFDELAIMTESERLSVLLPPDSLLASLPRLDIDAESALLLAQGKHIATPDNCPMGNLRAYMPRGFLGLVEAGTMLVPSRLMDTSELAGKSLPGSPTTD